MHSHFGGQSRPHFRLMCHTGPCVNKNISGGVEKGVGAEDVQAWIPPRNHMQRRESGSMRQ